ncbi:chemotaxis protein CheW [Photobacterium sp. GJ3]|nr:chemotaxis protein CheW [Photobacterium sp. GJ3]
MAQLQRLLDQMSAMQDQVVSESEACVAELHQLAALSEETEASVETGLDAPGWFEDQGSEGDRVQEDAVYSLPLAETAVLDISEPQLAPFAEPEDDFRLMQHLPQIAAAPEMPEPEESTSTALEPVQELVQEPIQDIAEAPVLETSSQPEMEILASAPDDDMLKGAVPETTVAESNQTVSAEPPPPSWVLPASSELSEFQALFFAVNGVTFAVPLTELGGIHQLGELSHLIGRPDWYLGLQSEQKRQLDVVDTARWVMPESIHSDDHRENYRYVVMLGESKWGLACDQLHGTETLTKQNVRWREKAGKRPWLAGMVKEKMCALIHVNELISMLKAGLDVNSIV